MAGNAQHHETAQKPETSWWRRLIAVVVTAGTLAGAITAIKALWPGPDLVDSVTFTSADVRSPERLSDFVARAQISSTSKQSTARHPAPHIVLVRTQASASPDSAGTSSPPSDNTSSPTESPIPSTSEEPSPSGSSSSASIGQSPSGSPSPTGTSTGPASAQYIRDLISQRALSRYDLHELVDPEPPSPHKFVYFTVAQQPDKHGNPLPPAVAAKRLAARFAAGRSAPLHGKRDPVGALVTVNMDLQGLRGQHLLLFWRLFPKAGTRPLPHGWWKTTVAYRLTPGTDHDSASVDMWVPVPKAKGPYTINLIMALEGNDARLASYDTAAFK